MNDKYRSPKAASKYDDLFKATVKLAHDRPELREHLLPILREAAEDGEKAARHEEGKSVDVGKWLRDNGHAEAAKKWDEYEGTLGKGEKKASEGPTPAHLLKFAAETPSARLSILPLIREVTNLPFLGEEAFAKFADKWQGMPKGWSSESRKKFWSSLTGDAAHKVTACMKKMEGKVDNTGAFCASLRDRVEGSTAWRGERAAADKAAKKYPTPAEVAKVAAEAATAIYTARGDALSDLGHMLQDAVEDATGTGVSFSGDTADKFAKRLKEAKDKLNKMDSGLMDLASMLEALSRDLKKVKKASDEWLSIDEVRKHCPPCADKMAAMKVTRVKASTLKNAMAKAAAQKKSPSTK